MWDVKSTFSYLLEQAQRRAAVGHPGTKDRGNLVPGPKAIFSHTMPKMDFYHSHCFIWEKAHKIDISHAMVISIITSPLT